MATAAAMAPQMEQAATQTVPPPLQMEIRPRPPPTETELCPTLS